jgi:hypothetical protein
MFEFVFLVHQIEAFGRALSGRINRSAEVRVVDSAWQLICSGSASHDPVRGLVAGDGCGVHAAARPQVVARKGAHMCLEPR